METCCWCRLEQVRDSSQVNKALATKQHSSNGDLFENEESYHIEMPELKSILRRVKAYDFRDLSIYGSQNNIKVEPSSCCSMLRISFV